MDNGLKKYNDLKIQFRAVPYGSGDHRVIEWRVDPEDNAWDREVKLLWGLVDFKYKAHAKTNWCQPHVFNYTTWTMYIGPDKAYYYSPVWCDTQDELDFYKSRFKTVGSFIEHLWNGEKESIKNYEEARKYNDRMLETLY